MRRQFLNRIFQVGVAPIVANLLPVKSAQAITPSVNNPLVIKFSHVVTEDTPKGKAALFFKKRVEVLSAGLMRVDIYPHSQLYRDREELEALQLGAVHMLAPSLAKFAPLGMREFEIFDLPFLFDTMLSYQT